MSRSLLVRIVVASLIGWGLGASGARAQDYPPYPRTPSQATELPPGYPPVDSSPSKRPLRDWWRDGRPLGCWSSFNGYGCSSLKSELDFIFGSCRTFYSEPCLKGAPPSALPPWATLGSGYYPGPGYGPGGASGMYPQKAGCNCP
jgi:hypothetical protein